MSSPQEMLSGLVERVTYHNGDTGYCVLRIKVDRQKDLITVVGHANAIAAGEFIQVSGQWINDKNYGLQFKASFLKACAPTSALFMPKNWSRSLLVKYLILSNTLLNCCKRFQALENSVP